MTATLDQRTIAALSKIATPDEIAVLQSVLDDISRGHAGQWTAVYIAAIITRLADIPSNSPERR